MAGDSKAGDSKDSGGSDTSSPRETQRDDTLPPDVMKKSDHQVPRDDQIPRRYRDLVQKR